MDEESLLLVFGLLVRHFRVEQIWSVQEAAIAVTPLFVNFSSSGSGSAGLGGVRRVLDALVDKKLLDTTAEGYYEFTLEARDRVARTRRMLGS